MHSKDALILVNYFLWHSPKRSTLCNTVGTNSYWYRYSGRLYSIEPH